MTSALIGFAVGIVILIVGYKSGHKDGEMELLNFLHGVAPDEMEVILKRLGILANEMNMGYEDGKKK